VSSKSKTKNVVNETNSLKLKEKDVTTKLSKFAMSETTLCCRRNIVTKSSSSSTLIKFKNLSITLIVLDYEENNVDKRALSF